MIAFGEALPQLRVRLEQDMARPGLPREKVLATVVRLLETTLIRVGNLEYARANSSFGLTTLRNRHVKIAGATLQFHFRGKSGQYHTVRLHDHRLAMIVKRCQELPGYELFQYIDSDFRRPLKCCNFNTLYFWLS
jgi:DNA topoisomerase I